MKKYKLVLKVKDIGFNGAELQSDVEVVINAEDQAHAQEKAQRAADKFAQFGIGRNATPPAFTLTEVS